MANGNGAEIRFRVGSSANDLLSYFDKIEGKGKNLTNSLIDGAKKEAETTKQQIKLIEEEIAAIEKKRRVIASLDKAVAKGGLEARLGNVESRSDLISKLRQGNFEKAKNKEITLEEYEQNRVRIRELDKRNTPENITAEFKEFSKRQADILKEEQAQTKFAKDNIQTVREAAKENVKAVKSGDASIEDILSKSNTVTERLAAELAKEDLDGERERKGRKGSGGFTTGLLTVDNIQRLISETAKFTQTKNGFDLISPASNTIGRVVGGILGAVVGGLVGEGVGAVPGAAIGAELGGAIGGAAGDLTQRRAIAMQDYQSSINKYSATTGANKNGFGVTPMAEYGLASQDYINLMRETVRAAGRSANGEKLTQDVYFANKGYGVDQGVSYGIIELFRSSNKENNQDLANIIGGILEKGKDTYFKNGDQTFLNEFLSKFATLQKELLKNSNSVATGTTFSILKGFNDIGGQFATRDPRSTSLINAINNSLVNPSNEFAQAADFIALRQANPNMDLIDLLKERSKGLGSEKYLPAVLSQIRDAGGGRSQEILNIANRLGLGNNFDAAESIYKNIDKLINNRVSLKEIGVGTDLSGRAKDNTTVLEKNMAEISDGLLKGWYNTLDAMKDSFGKAMSEVVNGMKLVEVVNGKYQLVRGDYSPSAAYKSAIYTGGKGQVRSPSGFNVADSMGRAQAMFNGDYGAKY